MDQQTANVVSKSVDKLFYLGVGFGTLLAIRLALDISKYWDSPQPEHRNSKTHSSKPVQDHEPTTHSSQNSPTMKQRVAQEEVEVKPTTFKLQSHNISENQNDEFVLPKLNNDKSNSGNKSNVLRKNSVVENKVGVDTTIIKICFTGGPCAGKTTAISTVANRLRDKGYDAMCAPEAATLIFGSGGILDMQNYTVYQGLQFQKALMGLQIAIEKQFVDLISIKPDGKYAFVLCDRGLLDGSAYIEEQTFNGLLEESGLDRSDCLNTYDIVIHMVTAAKGAEEHYTVENNAARSEGIAQAIELDMKLSKAWCMHPNFFYNDNNVDSFAEKVQRAENFILKKLGMPVGTDFHKKFAVRNPQGKLFKYLTKTFKCVEIELTDTFFDRAHDEKPEDKTAYYVRKRVLRFSLD